jgi:alpha-N-acetylglucosaminidase
MKGVLTDINALTACHRTFSLKTWIDEARLMGKDNAEKDYYEKNARTLITVWGDTPYFCDYAGRGWSGLISSYYAVRWEMFIDEVTDCAVQHRSFDEKSFKEKCNKFERSVIEPSYGINYVPSGDGVALAKKLLAKYFE